MKYNNLKLISIRLHKTQLEILEDLTKHRPDLYKSKGHVIRCAINYFLKKANKDDILKEVMEDEN